MGTDTLLIELESQLQALRPLAARSAQDLAAEQMREQINLGLWPPGYQLPTERELAEQLGVGRQTVREAVRALVAEGKLLPGRARSAPRVATLELQGYGDELCRRQSEFLDVLQLRRLLEGRASELAAKNGQAMHIALMVKAQGDLRTALAVNRRDLFRAADTSFHLAVAAASGSPALCDDVRTARASMFPALDALVQSTDELHDSWDEHERVLEAVRVGDAPEAARRMDEHLEQTERRLLKLLQSAG